MGVALLLLLFVAMWFFTVRPQQQRLKAQRALIQALQPGDEVVTIGGLIGIIRRIDDNELTLDLGGGTNVRLARSAVSSRFTSGPEPEPEPPALEP